MCVNICIDVFMEGSATASVGIVMVRKGCVCLSCHNIVNVSLNLVVIVFKNVSQ